MKKLVGHLFAVSCEPGMEFQPQFSYVEWPGGELETGAWRGLTWGESGQWLPLKRPRQLPLSTERDGRGPSLVPAVARGESGII